MHKVLLRQPVPIQQALPHRVERAIAVRPPPGTAKYRCRAASAVEAQAGVGRRKGVVCVVFGGVGGRVQGGVCEIANGVAGGEAFGCGFFEGFGFVVIVRHPFPICQINFNFNSIH